MLIPCNKQKVIASLLVLYVLLSTALYLFSFFNHWVGEEVSWIKWIILCPGYLIHLTTNSILILVPEAIRSSITNSKIIFMLLHFYVSVIASFIAIGGLSLLRILC